MSDKIKPKNPLLEDLENKEIVPTGTTDKLIFRDNNPFNVWRGSQYLTPQYTPGRDYIAYSNGENIWRVPLEKIYPINDDDLTSQQILERDWRKSPAYGIDKVILGTLAGTMAPFAVAEAAPALATLATGASDATMATRAGQAIYQGLTSPVGKAALSSIFGGMGAHNFFSDNGYAKTLQEWNNLKNDPNFYNAVNFGKSALGNAMDATMMAPLYKPLIYAGKEAWNAGKQGVEGAWNLAAKYGNDYARARQLSKLFNSGIEKTTLRSNPRYISQNGVNYSLYDSFGEPIGNAMIGDLNGNGRNMVHSIKSARKNAHKVSEDIYNTAIDNITSSGGEGLESGWDLLSPHKTLPVTEKFPHLVIGESQGHDVRLLTGTTERPLPQYIEGNHYLDITPKTKIQFNKETGKFEKVPVQTAVDEPPTLSWEEASRPYLDWSPDNWFKNISGRTSYSAEEAEELASFVPEYRQIEKRLWNEGKLTTDINGNVIVKDSEMSPQEYVMRQSKNFQKKMNPEHHYVGVKKELRDNFENGSRDPYGEGESYEVWTDRKSPKNVEEYAYSGFGGKTIDDEIKSIEELYKGTEQYYESKVKDLQQEKEWLGDLMSDAEYNRKLDEIKMLRENDLSGYRKGLEALTKKRETDPLNGGKIYDVTYPKETAEPPIIDAEGSHWSMIPFENARRDAPDLVLQYLRHAEWPEHISTNSLVKASELQDYGVTHINNVMDTGNGTLLNETIIGKDTPIKSVLGNTGAFSLEGPNRWKLYRSFLPWLTGAGTAGTLYGVSQDNTHAYGGSLNTYKLWNDLSVKEKSDIMKVAIRNGITNLADIKAKYNEFAEGKDTVGEWVDAIYSNNPKEEFLGEPSHHYDFTESDGWADAHGYYPDSRGHRDDRVKKPSHPSHPSRGTWDGDKFILSDLGMQNPNYTLFGLNDGGQDPQAILTYNGGTVIPEITATPEENYIYNPYDNFKISFAEGGYMPSKEDNDVNMYSKGDKLKKGKGYTISPNAQYAMKYFMSRGLAPHQAAGLVGNLMRESGLNPNAVNPNGGAFGLAQWLGKRKKDLFAKYGNKPSFNQQLDFIWHELNTTHKNGLKYLRASRDANEAAQNAFGWYEFSVGPQGAVADMNKHNQNGMASLNQGVRFASRLLGQPIPENIQLNIPAAVPQGNAIAVQPQMYQMQQPVNPFEGWEPSNPQAFYGHPEQMGVIEQLAQQNAQMQAAFEKQEAEKLLAAQQQTLAQEREAQRNRTNLALQMVGMMGGDDSDNSYYDMWKPLINMGAYGGHLYDGWTEPTGLMNRKRLDDIQNLNNDIFDFEKNASSNNEFSTITDAETGEVGQIMGITPDGTYRTVYPSGTYNMTLDLPNTDVLGSKARMRAARGLEAPLLGGELKDNQYRTMPTNSEANAFADAWTEQTAPTVGHLISAGLKPLDLITPSRYVGLLDSDNKNGFLHLFDEDNRGFFIGDDPTKPFSKQFHDEHPIWAGIGNSLGDVAIGYGSTSGIGKIAGGVNNYTNNVLKRGAEVAMRTTLLANPIPEVKNGVALLWNGQNGGKARMAHIANYILTGAKRGPKGYYNSVAGYIPLNSSNLLSDVSLSQRWHDFLHPNGQSFAYSGFVNNVGRVPKITERNDIIDAFLYNKKIDPSFGLVEVSKGKGFGPHTRYVAENYADKVNSIPVYEFNNIDHPVSSTELVSISPWEGAERGLFTSNYDDFLNAAGHLKQQGVTTDGMRAVRRQDIWKFNPKEYMSKWVENERAYQEASPFTRAIINLGINKLDKLGTPIITRTKWEKTW